jgi:hypothetical protein
MITGALASDEAADYIRLCLDEYGVATLSDFVEAIENGDFAEKILKIYPSASSEEKQTLHAVISNIAKNISDIRNEKISKPTVYPSDDTVVVGLLGDNTIYYRVGINPTAYSMPAYDQYGCLTSQSPPQGQTSNGHVVNYYTFNSAINELQEGLALANEAIESKQNAASALLTYQTLRTQIETVENQKLNKSGGTILGNLTVQGDFTVKGKVTSVDVQTVKVEDNIFLINSKRLELADLAGVAINTGTGSVHVYGIMYDPVSDSVKIGDGYLDENGDFHYYLDEDQNLATISWDIPNGNIPKFSQELKTLVDSGISAETVPHKSQIPQVWRY